MIPGSANPLLLASAAEAGAYEIERSVRFNSSDSAYLDATFGTPTDQDVFTLSMWVKRSALGSTQQLFGVSTNHSFGFTSGDALNLTFGGSSALTTTALFRDPSAWYHIVWEQNGTAHELYVNNVSVGTATATSNTFNTAVAHQIGAANTTNYFNGYLADIHFIDGQALDPTSFGEFDTNGVWQPIEYTGTYGTNGFHLPFSDNSTAAALGTDTSGNGNTWTVNNISVAAGAGNDSLVDTPTNYGTDTGLGGEVRGNYATLNPLTQSSGTFSNGNLEYIGPSNWRGVLGTIQIPSTGKWYAEATLKGSGTSGTWGGVFALFGVCSPAFIPEKDTSNYNSTNALWMSDTGIVHNFSTTDLGSVGALSTGDVVSLSVDRDANTYSFKRNNTVTSSGTINYTSGAEMYVVYNSYSGSNGQMALNFGQRPFAYTAPSGYKALCTANLPTPTIEKGSDYFDTKLYTGNGSTQTISGLDFSPDFVWIKLRSPVASSLVLSDAVRGSTNIMYSNLTNGEGAIPNSITSLNSDGFSIGSLANVNYTSGPHVAWCWDAGSSNVTNTDGSITSTVRANASAGFSIVTYTGNGTAGATIGHGLGVAPEMIIIKNRDAADAWQVYHAANTANPETDYLVLNTTAATADNANRWNDTAPGASVFTLGNGAEVNTNTEDYVAYCFTGVSGYTAMSSYTGNGNADGPFVFTNMRPRWILIKRTDTTSNWTIIDTAREGYNVDNDPLFPNLSNAEGTTDLADILSNGFKLRTTDASVNANTGTYIYFAIAETAFNYSRAR